MDGSILRRNELKHLPKAILWDLDGTIIDSTECHFQSWSEALKSHGYSISRDLFNSNYGRNNFASLTGYLGFQPDLNLANEITHAKEALFREKVSRDASMVAGVMSWLAAANQMGMKQAIASSAGMKNITIMLTAFGLLGYFDLLVSGANLPAKPKPDVFLEAAKLLELSPQECLVIEDSAAGVQAAKNAGMTCIAVLTSHVKSQLTAADLLVDDFRTPFADAVAELT
jgi:HAD superfamily hydrolase (TIGR01509 family)